MARSIGTETQIPIIRNPSWMSRPWRIRSFQSGFGVSHFDILLFTSPGKIKIRNLQGVVQDWSTSCQLTATGEISGHTTLGNRPFFITYDSVNKQLECKISNHGPGPGRESPSPGYDVSRSR
jgi:hypothetical protein